MKTRQFVAGITAMACAFTLFAAPVAVRAEESNEIKTINEMDGNGKYGAEITGNGTISLPIIRITVPSSVKFALNPYNKSLAVSGTTVENSAVVSGGTTVSDSVVSAIGTITSYSESAIQVGATVSVADNGNPGDIKFLTAKPATKDTSKSALVYLQVGGDLKDNVKYDSKTNKNKVLLGAKAVTENELTVITKCQVIDSTTTPGTVVTTGSEAVDFAFRGETNSNYTKWKNDDKLDVKVEFTFTPTSSN